jgi:glycine dehydrogenase subunit 2
VAENMTEEVAALMLTNPNTLGLFEEHIQEVAEIVHRKGGFVFGDGANLNALMGKGRPGDFGIDAMQFNLHKTFSTPHGGGGPGAGPIGVCDSLAPYLPTPRPVKTDTGYRLSTEFPKSIGRVRSFAGNFGVMVRAYAFIREMGVAGLTRAAEMAVLNANYLLSLLKDHYDAPVGNGRCMHECVFTDKHLVDSGVTTLDVAKALIDRGFHPPTIYFPLVVKGALMCEPTESETPETLGEFAEAMKEIAELARRNPDAVKQSPVNTRLSRLDEATAARKPILKAE